MPSIGLPPFLQRRFGGSLWQVLCQCPQSGYLHFYRTNTEESRRKRECVNALNRATSISTKDKIKGEIQMKKSVNALKRATSISTQILRKHVSRMDCVNALKRATSISTKYYAAFDVARNMCQCPQTGYIHFYKKLQRRL